MNKVAPNLTLESVCAKAANLPCTPDLVPKILDLLKDPDAPATSLIELISRDPATSASILRLANSAYFGRVKCESLAEAFLRLGNKEIIKVVSGGLVGKWLSLKVNGYGWEPGDLCTHSFVVAIVAEKIADKFGNTRPEIAYTAGLLHDIGKLGMAYACGDYFDHVRKLQQEKPQIPWRELEREVFGFDYTEVGATLLRRWNYPESLISVARFYPVPRAASEPLRPLVVIVHAAKCLALNIGCGVGEEGFSNELDEDLLKTFNYTPSELNSLIPEIVQDIEKIIGPDGKIQIST
ncbi:MAG: HDOD domain-containing protein [Chthoniobacterales bacterium]|nr:HDOD domain-containing protein [Chthoniobacterales bacterium]